MRELFVETRTMEDEVGKHHKFRYFVVVDEMKIGHLMGCESYGVKVAEDGGDTAVIPNITVSISRIDALMELLGRNVVSPAGLGDVIADWL